MIRGPISRRTLLKGAGVALAVPFLEAMLPRLAFSGQTSALASAFPNRWATLYIPNGVEMQYWHPAETGRNYAFSRTLEPLSQLRDDILLISGTSCDKAKPNGDGAGDHARAIAAFMTGVQARKTEGANIRNGISADQFLANRIGNRTRFPSLELGIDYGRLGEGGCDPGYACIYSNNLARRSETTPAIKEVNPRVVFDRLFADRQATTADGERRLQSEVYNRSILDFVRESVNNLNSQLGAADLRRMDEYLTSVREIERRLEAPPEQLTQPLPAGTVRPTRVPETFREHFRLMSDLMLLAFQTDATRIVTFMLGVEQSRRTYREIGISEEHHGLTHHGGRADWVEKVAQIDNYIVQQIAYTIERAKSIREGDGTLLDHCMIFVGNGNGNAVAHDHNNLPLILAGRGNGTLSPGRHLAVRRGTPVMNLMLGLMDRMGVEAESFGDSTGRISGLVE